MGKTLFVTVGTTKFDALIKAVDTEDFGTVLLENGFTKVVLQVGKGEYKPHVLCTAGKQKDTWRKKLAVEWFEFAPNLQAYMRSADVILSHAGSGSLFEALALELPTVAVPNPILMHNHQEQLARHLADEGYLWCCTTDGLVDTFRNIEPKKLRKYLPGDAADMVKRIDTLMGF